MSLCRIIFFIFVTSSVSFSVAKADNFDEYTPEEIEALKKLRTKLSDRVLNDPYYSQDTILVRWLRARDLNVEDALIMGNKALKWREENGIDSIVNKTVIDFNPPAYRFEGHDRAGRPIVLCTPTTINLRHYILNGKRELILRAWYQFLERGHESIKNLNGTDGKPVRQVTVLLDGHGYSVRQHFCLQCISLLAELMYTFENYFPDALKHAICINTSRLAVPLIEFVRPFMSKSTARSLKIFGPDRAEWSAFIHTIISPDQIPYRFGGTKPN